MATIKPYLPEHKALLLEIFRSNVPLYFAEEEFALFDAFLDADINARRPYWVIEDNEQIVGCGGIGINQPTKYTPVEHVIMCWGMVHHEKHKRGYGRLLLKHRIEQAKLLFPGIRIALGTTQHSFPFFEKYGFNTVYYEKDHWAEGLDLYQMELQEAP